MPGTAAEILHDPIRKICPGKLTVKEWVEVMKTAHHLGIPSSATMMYGLETLHLAAHLQIIREIQRNARLYRICSFEFYPPQYRIVRRGYCGPGASG